MRAVDAGLDKLKSYQVNFTYGFDGKDEQGKTQKGSFTLLQDVITGSKDSHIKFTGLSALGGIPTGASTGAGDTFEMFQVGDTAYLNMGGTGPGAGCMGVPAGAAQSSSAMAPKPSDMLSGFSGAKLAKRNDTVNGISADQFDFDQSSFGTGTFTSAKGSVWIAQDGGYVVKYTGQATGKEALFGKGTEGTYTWEYDLQNVNKIASIALPDQCKKAPIGG